MWQKKVEFADFLEDMRLSCLVYFDNPLREVCLPNMNNIEQIKVHLHVQLYQYNFLSIAGITFVEHRKLKTAKVLSVLYM